MKIGPLDSKPPIAPAAPERKGTAAAPAAAAEASAQVELSQAASALASPAADASFDASKVERIAQAIRDGKFTVNPEAIADKLIVNAEELLGRKPN
jgi:negative regulator of flagellin synthesis FlgM